MSESIEQSAANLRRITTDIRRMVSNMFNTNYILMSEKRLLKWADQIEEAEQNLDK